MSEAIERAAEDLAGRFSAQVQARMPEVRERFQAIQRMLSVPFTDADVGGYAFAEAVGLVTLNTEPPALPDQGALDAYADASARVGVRAVAVLAPEAGMILVPELHRVIIAGSDSFHCGEDLGFLSALFSLRFAGEETASRAREDADFERALARAVWQRLRPAAS